ncbi:MAG: hypothetical protein ACI4D7_12010 [Lachnospiraceae bacterium]
MEKLTEKERSCLVNYTDDLLQLMIEEGVSVISDCRNEYTKVELEILASKLSSNKKDNKILL